MPNKIVKGLKVNGRDRVTERHNSAWGQRNSNQFGDANFMEQQLRRVFYDTFLRKQNSRSVPSWYGAWGWAAPQHSFLPPQHWAQALMGRHLLCACPRPHWGNEAVSVCCSGGLCVPFITVTTQKHTEKGAQRGGSALQSVRLWALQPQAPRGGYPTLGSYISISAFWVPTVFVWAHSGCQDMCLWR